MHEFWSFVFVVGFCLSFACNIVLLVVIEALRRDKDYLYKELAIELEQHLFSASKKA